MAFLAGAGSTVETINGLLKQVYDDEGVENLINEETVTLKRIGKSPKNSGGEGFVFPVKLEGNERGQGSQNELEALRIPAVQVVKKGTILPKVFTHNIRFSGLSLEVAEGNEESFADDFTFQMDEGVIDAAKERNAQLFRDGSGKIAQVAGAVAASATITFDNGVPTHFRNGMYLDAVNGGGVRQMDSQKIIDVDVANNQITMAAVQNIDDNAFLYREDVEVDAPASGKEWAGLPLVTDDGTLATVYENIDRTVYQAFQGLTFDALTANVSNDMLERAISRVKVRSGRKPDKVISNTSQFRKYLDVVTPLKRFEGKEKMDSGYEEVPTWNGMEWIVDTDCGFSDIYILSLKYIERYEVRPLKFDDKGGGILKWDSGFDGFYCYAKAYDNIGCKVPNAGIRITNLAVPSF